MVHAVDVIRICSHSLSIDEDVHLSRHVALEQAGRLGGRREHEGADDAELGRLLERVERAQPMAY